MMGMESCEDGRAVVIAVMMGRRFLACLVAVCSNDASSS